MIEFPNLKDGQNKLYCSKSNSELICSIDMPSRCDHTREVQSLKMCQGHPNIVVLYEVYHDDVSKVTFYFY